MALFVINEWLWADSSGENGKNAQLEAFEAIHWLGSSDYQIVVIEGSPFDKKGWALCNSGNTIVIRPIKIYVGAVRQNSDRCIVLKPEAVLALPEELARAIKPDDHYLVRAQLSVTGAILVTTDSPLREAVIKAGLQCLSREEFLTAYIGQEQPPRFLPSAPG